MDEIEWWEFDSAAELAEQVAGDIAFVIESAIEAHGGARLALPGGRTPDAIYQALLANDGIDWTKVTIVPTDDRLVPLDDPRSNYAKLNGYFGDKGAQVVSLVDESTLDDYRAAGRAADQRLALLDWPLDLVWLGMGEDGHVASFFPGPDFDRSVSGPRERRAVGVRPDPMPQNAPVERVTLTGAALAGSRTMMIVIDGANKRERLERAISEGPLSDLAVGRILAELDAAVDVYWTA